ncbi:MAG: DNA-directed RNA polymerase subunit beta' [Chloroflexi bacterium]|nr:DNA-directed RNA polymerase subunit beta' [Chloroflexota bacterium]
MLEVNNFNAVRITLASPEQIRSWSRGEVTKPETINYRTLKPERDGLFCERIFGPTKDWECSCGKYKRVRYKGIVCDKCGVEVTRAKVRRERMGHIELASPVSHIWFVKGTPSRIGLLLDVTPRLLEQVLYFAKYIITDINETQRQRLIQQIQSEAEERIEREARDRSRRVEELTTPLMTRLADLEDDKTQALRDLESELERMNSWIDESSNSLRERVNASLNEPAEDDLVFGPNDTVLVKAGDVVKPSDLTSLDDIAKVFREQYEEEMTERQRTAAEPYDNEIDRVKAEIEAAQLQVEGGEVAFDAEGERQRADLRVKRIEGIKALQTLNEAEFRELVDLVGSRVFKAGMGAEAVWDLLSKVDMDKLAQELRMETRSSSGQRRKKATKRLRVVEAFRKSGNRPEWMVMKILPVLPPDLRPMVQLDGGRFATSDLNDLYRRVINRNNRLKRLLELGAPEIIIRNEKRMLQEAVDSLIDNGRRGRAVSGSSNHKLKSLSDMLKGKQGRFRQNLLGKRVDYSGRSVIVVGPELKLHQCGLPKRMALELFKPFVMRKLVERGHAHNIKSAKRIVERVRPEVWDVLEEVIQDHPVLLNRAPTLHRLGIQAFEPVLIEGSAIQIHPLVTSAFNADFDGDQMAVHVPLSAAAKREAREQMLSVNNLLLPSNGEPVVAPTLDMVLGCFYLTTERPQARGHDRKFGSWADAIRAYDMRTIMPEAGIDLQARVTVRMHRDASGDLWEYDPTDGHLAEPDQLEMVPTTVGRVILFKTINDALRDVNSVPLPFQNERIDKGRLKGIVATLIRQYGNRQAAAVLDVIKTLGFRYATQSGTTVAVTDITIPAEKQGLLADADAEVSEIEKQFRRGLITNEERYNEVIAVWTRTKDAVTSAVDKALDPFGPITMMAESGAKGNIQQISQMSGMRGLMADPSGGIIELPIRSSFREGLSVLEYFLSTHGARKGLADTAIRTSDSGYLTRRLIDVAQNVIVYDPDCGTEAGIWIEDLTDPQRRQNRLDQLVGRYLAGPVVDPVTGVVLIDMEEDGAMIAEDERDIIARSEVPRVYVRSPLACESRHGVCQRCYGWHLGRRSVVEIGDAVGIVAAQSIGEPGTQLTMRTFHTGGVARVRLEQGGEDGQQVATRAAGRPMYMDITSGLPRVEELFEARTPKGIAILSDIDGVVEVQTLDEGRIIKVVSSEVYRDEQAVRPGYQTLVAEGDWVEVNQPLAELEDEPPIVARLSGTVQEVGDRIVIVAEEREEREYRVPSSSRIRVENGQTVSAGDQLTEGHKSPEEVLRIQGRESVERYLVDEVQEVYRSQGVNINDKHIEIIVRQMLRKLRVDVPGDTDLLPAELVDRFEYEEKNRHVLAEGGEPATAQPVLLGVTKASLNTESFLAAASFQETTKVLTEAALSGKVDKLLGLKENVIIGKLIPAGSGYKARMEARLAGTDRGPEGILIGEDGDVFELESAAPSLTTIEGGLADDALLADDLTLGDGDSTGTGLGNGQAATDEDDVPLALGDLDLGDIDDTDLSAVDLSDSDEATPNA